MLKQQTIQADLSQDSSNPSMPNLGTQAQIASKDYTTSQLIDGEKSCDKCTENINNPVDVHSFITEFVHKNAGKLDLNKS